jgi:hypothetical protein
MLSNRFFEVFLGNQSSRWNRLKNDLPQGSVLAPILFNLYMLDLASFSLNLFQYADDIVLTHQANKFVKCEIHHEEGLETLSRFFHQWRLRPNPSKTQVCVFHLGTNNANRKLTVQVDNTLITHDDHPKYLEMTLDRTLSFIPHLEKTRIKMSSCVKLENGVQEPIRYEQPVYRLFTAEYCTPVWLNSVHVNKVDVQLNNAMPLITRHG